MTGVTGKALFQPREPYDETAYLTALQALGLMPPADRGAIHRAYRDRAKRVHPDRFQNQAQKAEATRAIQEINAAHAYAIQHWRGHQLAQRWGGSTPARTSETTWQEWLFLPVTAVYALTTIIVAAPVLALARLAGPERRVRWRERRAMGMAWRAWVVMAPHGATVALFASVDELAVRLWFGLSFLVMVAADIATLVTGDTNMLRRPLAGALVKLP